MAVKVESIIILRMVDDEADPRDIISGDPDYEKEERRRIRDFGQTWGFMGVAVEAKLIVEGTIQFIRTAGVWGVEENYGEGDENARFVGAEEYGELLDILKALGIRASQVPPIERARVVDR